MDLLAPLALPVPLGSTAGIWMATAKKMKTKTQMVMASAMSWIVSVPPVPLARLAQPVQPAQLALLVPLARWALPVLLVRTERLVPPVL